MFNTRHDRVPGLGNQDARKMALNMRLIDRELYKDHSDNKASQCAKMIAEYYRKYDAQKGMQFVFSDLGTFQPGQ